MFTHEVVPLHIENLLGFLKTNSSRKFTREDVKNCFQPPSVTEKQSQSQNTVRATLELNLVKEGGEKVLELTKISKGKESPGVALRKALDLFVLNATDVEYYFALFYAYALGRNDEGIQIVSTNAERWVLNFNRDVFANEKQDNPFNKEKFGKLMRWFVYAGLGWTDQSGQFNCNPYYRTDRCVKAIFGSKKKLECDEFLNELSKNCPELDGGKLFLQANKKYDANAKRCTLGLSHALVDLHLDGIITLHCPKDSDGWSIALAGPPSDGKTMMSDRISQVEIGKTGAR